jgi:hypothetical protein
MPGCRPWSALTAVSSGPDGRVLVDVWSGAELVVSSAGRRVARRARQRAPDQVFDATRGRDGRARWSWRCCRAPCSIRPTANTAIERVLAAARADGPVHVARRSNALLRMERTLRSSVAGEGGVRVPTAGPLAAAGRRCSPRDPESAYIDRNADFPPHSRHGSWRTRALSPTVRELVFERRGRHGRGSSRRASG